MPDCRLEVRTMHPEGSATGQLDRGFTQFSSARNCHHLVFFCGVGTVICRAEVSGATAVV
jgi:hypothetical protein